MKKVDVYRKSIDQLEEVIGAFEQELEKPERVRGAFVYKEPTVKHVCFLKGVRIVSGLNALLVLFQAGYVTEMGVLIRMMSDCMNAIYFLLEHFPDKTPEVERYMSHFFSDTEDEAEIVLSENRRIHRTKVKKIHESRARLLSEHINFAVGRDMVYRHYSDYSGYVHAAYLSAMELYAGEQDHKFHLRGMKGTSRIRNWETVFVALIRSSTLVFGYMAEKYDKANLIHEIRKIMNWFDKEMMDAMPRR
jgi:hypothetical protein